MEVYCQVPMAVWIVDAGCRPADESNDDATRSKVRFGFAAVPNPLLFVYSIG